jgi:hypothetical protein
LCCRYKELGRLRKDTTLTNRGPRQSERGAPTMPTPVTHHHPGCGGSVVALPPKRRSPGATFYFGEGLSRFHYRPGSAARPPNNHGPGPRGLRAHVVSTHPQLVQLFFEPARCGSRSPVTKTTRASSFYTRCQPVIRFAEEAPIGHTHSRLIL